MLPAALASHPADQLLIRLDELLTAGMAADVLATCQAALSEHPGLQPLKAHDPLRLSWLDLQARAAYAVHDLVQAEHCWQTILHHAPGCVAAHNNLGNLYEAQLDYPAAEHAYQQALCLQPQQAESWLNLAQVYRKQRRYPEAIAALQHAIQHRPDYPDACNALGLLFMDQQQDSQAAQAFQHTLALAPGHAEARCNLGLLAMEQGDDVQAEKIFHDILADDPNHSAALQNLTVLYLSRGRFAEGWPLYEARYDTRYQEDHADFPQLPFPRWRGEALDGKRLLILCEQGFGDEIQFARYARQLKQQHGVAWISWVCKAELHELFLSLRDVDAVMTFTGWQDIPAHDYWSLALSLPLHCHTTRDNIPAELPYLAANPQRIAAWQPHLPPRQPTQPWRIGLLWQGNPAHTNDHQRSIPHLRQLTPLWQIPGIQWVSLQKGTGEAQIADCPEQALLPLGGDIQSFADSAAIVAQLDLVISVDSAIAHLAGALACPVWVLIPARRTDWRWQRDGEDSPWYPQVMRLFRQRTDETDWRPTILRLHHALHEFTQTVK